MDHIYTPQIEIQRVLELHGTRDPIYEHATPRVFAYVTVPLKIDSTPEAEYALLTLFPQHGVMYLGGINPQTKIFDDNEPLIRALYEQAGNKTIRSVCLPLRHLDRLQTLDEILRIEGITIVKELTFSS